MSLSLPGKPKPYVMAHRGNRVACPENTLAAFRRALEDGADILETDLHLTRDGVFVCLHDATVDRTTNGQGRVDALTLSELKQLSANYGRTEFALERVPTLAELAALLPAEIMLALELKTDAFCKPAVARRLADELQALGVRARTVVLSFHMPRVLAVRAAAPDIPIGYITMSNPLPNTDAQLFGPFWPLAVINPFYARLAHARGGLACPLDPTPDSRLWLYRLLGFDAVLTDDPAATLRALGRVR
jgi:glycerophosphoryl diester phosphodiesterase